MLFCHGLNLMPKHGIWVISLPASMNNEVMSKSTEFTSFTETFWQFSSLEHKIKIVIISGSNVFTNPASPACMRIYF